MIDVRNRLVKALHTTASLPALREEIVLFLCELEDVQCAPTLRSTDLGIHDAAPDTERESAPSTERASALGQEYGV
jgi:hypothetical protein